tara:strand:+ start:595 stop:774 length:180 start_codon:yes stop_codon:yes gene_type:complete
MYVNALVWLGFFYYMVITFDFFILSPAAGRAGINKKRAVSERAHVGLTYFILVLALCVG